jgi:putative flippase GtrA
VSATRQPVPAAPEAAGDAMPDAFSWRGATWEERWLRFYRSSITRFAAFGALGLAIDVTILMILRVWTPLPLQAAVIIAFALTYLINFFLNRKFAFHAGHGVSRQLTKFIPQVIADYALTALGVGFLTGLGMPTFFARVLSASTNAVLNYVAYRYWTFRPVRKQPQDEDGAA